MSRTGWGIGILLGALLTACATVSYQEPTSGDRARVRFALGPDTPDHIVVVRGYVTEDCAGEQEWMRLKNGSLFKAEPKKLGIALWAYPDNAAKEFYLAAGKPAHVMFEHAFEASGIVQHCAVMAPFTPEAGRDYELLFSQTSINACFAGLSEITGGDNPQRKAIQIFSATTSPGCLAAVNKMRMY